MKLRPKQNEPQEIQVQGGFGMGWGGTWKVHLPGYPVTDLQHLCALQMKLGAAGSHQSAYSESRSPVKQEHKDWPVLCGHHNLQRWDQLCSQWDALLQRHRLQMLPARNGADDSILGASSVNICKQTLHIRTPASYSSKIKDAPWEHKYFDTSSNLSQISSS